MLVIRRERGIWEWRVSAMVASLDEVLKMEGLLDRYLSQLRPYGCY